MRGKGHHGGSICKAPGLAVGNGDGDLAIFKEAFQTLHKRRSQRNVSTPSFRYMSRNMRDVSFIIRSMGKLTLPPLATSAFRGIKRTWWPCILQNLQQARRKNFIILSSSSIAYER